MKSLLILVIAIFLESEACSDDPCSSKCPPGFIDDNCTIRARCPGVVLEGTSFNRLRANILAGANEVEYGETAVVECVLDDKTLLNKTMYCSYDHNSGGYTLQGDRPLCPVTDCGDALDIPGSSPPRLALTHVGQQFDFICKENYTRVGSSNATQNEFVVECDPTGRWNYGDLACVPENSKGCRDPGTPTDAYQSTDGYFVGGIVSYTCKKEGYKPLPDPVLECILDSNGDAKWNASMPFCYDKSKPVFENCPDEPIYGKPMESLNYPVPNATDNTGVVSVFALNGFSGTVVFNSDKNITFVADDEALNREACVVMFKMERCKLGQYSADGFSDCKDCPINYYSHPNDSRLCLECPSDTINVGTGSADASACVEGVHLCSLSLCQRGECYVRFHRAVCQCYEGFTGVHCDMSINSCPSSGCLNGGTCESYNSSTFECSCAEGFEGRRCQIDAVNDCKEDTCTANGFCQDGINETTCICKNKNESCVNPVDLCTGRCERGECVQFGNVRAHCICPAAYTGDRCEQEIDQCLLNPKACLNGGTCVNIVGEERLTCDCKNGWTGSRCEIPPTCQPEVTTMPSTTENPCAGFTMNKMGNIGHKPHEDCDKYYTCLKRGRILTRTCDYGTFWNQDSLKCDNVSSVFCFNDPCNTKGSYKTTGKCYEYYQCKDHKTVTATCPYGKSYKPGMNQRCRYDSSCEHPEPCLDPSIRSYKISGKCYEFYRCVNGKKRKRFCRINRSYPRGVNKRCRVDYKCKRSVIHPPDPCEDRSLRSYKTAGKCFEYYRCRYGRSRKAYCRNRKYYPIGRNNRCVRNAQCKWTNSWLKG